VDKGCNVVSVTDPYGRIQTAAIYNNFVFLQRDFNLLHNVWTYSGAHPAPYTMVTELFTRGERGRAVKVTTDLHLLSISRIMELKHH
jgi:hypothetical protein